MAPIANPPTVQPEPQHDADHEHERQRENQPQRLMRRQMNRRKSCAPPLPPSPPALRNCAPPALSS
jgi:hypothetical protein